MGALSFSTRESVGSDTDAAKTECGLSHALRLPFGYIAMGVNR